jgi:uncharacterized protein (TIGR01777 family)
MIGSAISDALLLRGDQVVGLTRDPEGARATNPTVEWLEWNPTLERPPARAFEAVDGVVNLVGETIGQRWSDQVKERIRASRETATRNLVHGMESAEKRPRVLVSASAVGYYGDRGESIIDESAPAGEDFLAQLCVRWEAAARDAERSGIRVVILRTGHVLDRRGGLLGRMIAPFKLGLGGPIGSGSQYMPWIHIDDLVAMYLWALDDELVRGIFNATSPTPATNRELSSALGRALHRPAVIPTPRIALRAMLGAEMAENVTTGQRAVPRRALDDGFQFRHTDLGEAVESAVS